MAGGEIGDVASLGPTVYFVLDTPCDETRIAADPVAGEGFGGVITRIRRRVALRPSRDVGCWIVPIRLGAGPALLPSKEIS